MTANSAIDQIIAVIRPWRSAIQPNNSAPSNCPKNPAEIINPICGGVSFPSGGMTGSTDAIASASKGSKKVGAPARIRALTCHHEVGRRSSRATMSSTDARVPATSMFPSPWPFRPCGLARLCPRQFQKSRRGVEADGVSHAVRKRHIVDEMPGLLDRFEGIVGREYHTVVPECTDRAVEWFRRAHARGRHHDVVLDVLRGTFCELDGVKVRSRAAVEAPEQERQGFAQMAECEPRAREAVEHPPKRDAKGGGAGLEGPFPRRPPQPVVAVQHGSGGERVGRMEIDERVQCLRPFPEGIERA